MDYYTLLQIPRYASDEEIRRAYHKLALLWHPDLNPDLPDAGEKLKQLNEAYRVLRNHDARSQYNRSIFAELSARRVDHVSVPATIPRARRAHKHRQLTPALFSLVVAMTFVCFFLAYRDTGALPLEWQDGGYQPVCSPAANIALSSAERESECRRALAYWQTEMELTPGGTLAQYNLATVYYQLSSIANERGDTDAARDYDESAHNIMSDLSACSEGEMKS